jgi:PAS domain S-box-containing protein
MTRSITPLASSNHPDFPFLAGGGEMGELTRNYDWSQTSLGTPAQWPQSLRTTLGILLHSAFPMFLFWGDELLCFYNDAFRPSLGAEGKHPALGRRGKEVWPEIWEFIGPLIEKVLSTGEPVWFENQLVPFYRNGKIESIYWTFSYSPAYGDKGEINGVFVTCTETTKDVNTRQQLEESESLLRNMVEQAPVAITLTRGEEMVIESINAPMLHLMSKNSKEEVLGKKLIEVLPEVEDQPVLQIVKNVLLTGEAFKGDEVSVSMMANGKMKQYYLDLSYTPVIEKGIATAVLHVAIDVTDKVLSRKKVEESEKNLRNIILHAPVAMCLLKGVDHVVEIANQRIIDMWGAVGRNVLGKSIFDAVTEVKGQGFEQLLDHVYTTGETYKAFGVPLHVLRNGAIATVYVDFVYEPYREEEGNISGVMAVAIDVTEQIEARKKIENSEARLASIFEQAPVAITILRSTNFIIELANPFQLLIWERTGSEVIGKRLFEAFPEVIQQGFPQMLTHIMETGEPFEVMGHPVTISYQGEFRLGYFNLYYHPFREPDGAVSGIVAITTEVTDGVLARQAVEESEAKLRSLVESAPFPIGVYVGREKRIQFANQSIIDIWGKGNEVVGKLYTDILPELENQAIFAQMDKVYSTGIAFQAKNQQIDLVVEGKVRTYYFNYNITPLFNAAGKVYGVMSTAADVTDLNLAQKKIEESQQATYRSAQELAAANEEIAASNQDLSAANAQLVRINDDLDNFVYTASHDLKAPISNIEGLLQVLLRTLPAEFMQSERVRRLTSLMQESVERFKNTIASLTEVVKLQKENSTEAVQVDLREVVREVSLDLQPLIKTSGAELEIDIADCPPIHFSEKNLRSVVYNLISNAIKYCSPERLPRVLISCQAQAEYLVLSVQDNGLGMEAARIGQLFTMFKRFHTHVEGSGIGLYMIKKMIENAGGRIEVESQVGVGSTFRVFLPR